MTNAEQSARALMDTACVADNVRQSPWVRSAQRDALPHKVYASMHTDARVSVVRETQADILRRTMPSSVETFDSYDMLATLCAECGTLPGLHHVDGSCPLTGMNLHRYVGAV